MLKIKLINISLITNNQKKTTMMNSMNKQREIINQRKNKLMVLQKGTVQRKLKMKKLLKHCDLILLTYNFNLSLNLI